MCIIVWILIRKMARKRQLQFEKIVKISGKVRREGSVEFISYIAVYCDSLDVSSYERASNSILPRNKDSHYLHFACQHYSSSHIQSPINFLTRGKLEFIKLCCVFVLVHAGYCLLLNDFHHNRLEIIRIPTTVDYFTFPNAFCILYLE